MTTSETNAPTSVEPPDPDAEVVTPLRRGQRFTEAGILLALILVAITFTLINPAFASAENLGNVARTASFTFVAASMATYVFASGGLDLSVGSTLGVGAVIGGFAVVDWGLHPLIAIVIAMAAGALVGLINGVVTLKVKVPALVTTLGMLYAARGFVTIITGGQPVFPFPRGFTDAVIARVGPIPVMVILAAVLAVSVHFVLHHTRFGREILAVGGNRDAARLVGIRVDRVATIVYVLAGTAAALTGILLAARLGTAQSSAGTGYELVVIAAVIIGGTSLFGGSATIVGTAIGCLLLAALSNGMTVVGLSAFYQNLVVGVVIVVAVAVDQWRRAKSLAHAT